MRVNPPYDPAISNATLRRRLANNESQWPMALGCNGCSDLSACGGINAESKRYDCYDNCCGGKEDCQIICRENTKFPDQFNEIRGFELGTISKTLPLTQELPNAPVPLIYHSGHKANGIKLDAVFLRLRELVNFEDQVVRFKSKTQLCRHFGIHLDTKIYVTGIDQDRYIEKWWALTSRVRPRIIRELKAAGVSLITTPNYSMMTDVPRLDNLHSMKRIADNFAEFQVQGLAAALHPNSRTDKDFDRWAQLIASRREIKTLAYEFGTGSGRKDRISLHIAGLVKIASNAGRNLDIIIRGNTNAILPLSRVYKNITYIETSSFMKSAHYKKAIRRGNNRLAWTTYLPDEVTKLDKLFAHNIEETSSLLKLIYAQSANS